MPSYHALHITTAELPRTSLFDLPLRYVVVCSRCSGWELWECRDGNLTLLAGEYASKGLKLDIDGTILVDSLTEKMEIAT